MTKQPQFALDKGLTGGKECSSTTKKQCARCALGWLMATSQAARKAPRFFWADFKSRDLQDFFCLPLPPALDQPDLHVAIKGVGLLRLLNVNRARASPNSKSNKHNLVCQKLGYLIHIFRFVESSSLLLHKLERTGFSFRTRDQNPREFEYLT